ncbi:MAG: hypothetical protein GY830_07760 [Bacteroidetes bacterium]|nr:hypothetical protein [Bacteroidota bacterium]
MSISVKNIVNSYLEKSKQLEKDNAVAEKEAVENIETASKQVTQLSKKLEKAKNKVKVYEKEASSFKYISWVDAIIKPIAEEMNKKLENRYYDILGPFGLSAETSIHFYKNGVDKDEKFEGDNCLSISFRPISLKKGIIHVVDYLINTKQYEKNTTGELNGFNYLDTPIKGGIDWLLAFMNNQEKKKLQGLKL